ncbi:MAG: PIN domain-containing protein [Planctomycetes bacterium]|nr:PIN domain-containing protein [Planctomycetota bacterium]
MSLPRFLFDTSVLVPAMITAHEHHDLARPWLERAMVGEFRLVLSVHALAECFSVLTRLPGTLKCSPSMAHAVLKGNLLTRAKALVVALETDDYLAILDDLAAKNLAGGVIFDALHVRAARRHKARIVTFNQRDFARLVPDPTHDLILPT